MGEYGPTPPLLFLCERPKNLTARSHDDLCAVVAPGPAACRHHRLTYVLVGDPTQGYGIAAENMMNAAENAV